MYTRTRQQFHTHTASMCDDAGLCCHLLFIHFATANCVNSQYELYCLSIYPVAIGEHTEWVCDDPNKSCCHVILFVGSTSVASTVGCHGVATTKASQKYHSYTNIWGNRYEHACACHIWPALVWPALFAPTEISQFSCRNSVVYGVRGTTYTHISPVRSPKWGTCNFTENEFYF